MSSAVMSRTFGRVVCATAIPASANTRNGIHLIGSSVSIGSRAVAGTIRVTVLHVPVQYRLERLHVRRMRLVVRKVAILLRICAVVVQLDAFRAVVAPLG